MILRAEDIIYIIVYVITLMSIIFSLRSKLKSIEKDNRLLKNIIFGDKGKLNIIDCDLCKRNRDEVFTSIRKTESAIQMVIPKIDELRDNMLTMMIYLKIRGPNGLKKIEEETD